jgi:hypothetical protein
MAVNSEGIYATCSWKIFGAGPGAEVKPGNAQFNERNRQDLTAEVSVWCSPLAPEGA